MFKLKKWKIRDITCLANIIQPLISQLVLGPIFLDSGSPAYTGPTSFSSLICRCRESLPLSLSTLQPAYPFRSFNGPGSLLFWVLPTSVSSAWDVLLPL